MPCSLLDMKQCVQQITLNTNLCSIRKETVGIISSQFQFEFEFESLIYNVITQKQSEPKFEKIILKINNEMKNYESKNF